MTPMELIGANFAIVIGGLTLVWLLSVALKDVSIVDLCWGMGFVVIAAASLWLTQETSLHGIALAVMVALWGVRLTVHLGRRNIGKPEDHRYAAMREKRPDSFWLSSLFIVFWLQGVLMWFVSLPIQFNMLHSRPLGAFEFLGITVFAIGLFFETVGDLQLERFKANPENRGKVMCTGLWAYTRHPNYFGDCLVWWGIYLYAAPAAWWTIVSPLLMTFLLVRVSGVALLEKSLKQRREGYEEYVRKTSAFIPWPPQK